jgi:hypothetical protein
VQLHALTYERLELTEGVDQQAGSDARASQLWVGLARAALASAPDDARPLPTEPAVIARLDDPRWYVTRNLLALLEDLGPLPEGYSAAAYLRHPDARVRWQAVKLQFKQPADRTAALTAGLSDPDPRTLRLALGVAVATQTCPEEAVPVLASRASDRTVTADVRVLDRAGIEFDADLVGAFVRMMAQWEPRVTVLTDEHASVIPAVEPAVGS